MSVPEIRSFIKPVIIKEFWGQTPKLVHLLFPSVLPLRLRDSAVNKNLNMHRVPQRHFDGLVEGF